MQENSKGEKRGKGNWRRRGRRGGSSSPNQGQSQVPPKPQINYPDCSICSNTIKDVYSAVTYESAPAHFECVLKKIEGEETLGPKEKVWYIGNGTFAVVEVKSEKSNEFEIKKRIDLEDPETPVEWRKEFRVDTDGIPPKRNPKRGKKRPREN